MLSQKADYVLSNVIYTLNLKVTSELQMLLELALLSDKKRVVFFLYILVHIVA